MATSTLPSQVPAYDDVMSSAPPSYSPDPITQEGETVLERGPSRPEPLPSSYSTPRSSPPPALSGAVPMLGDPRDTLHVGHPLLHSGSVLIYPIGFACSKCRNTGYKNLDPTHPCKSCWSKHSRPYTGALLSADWESPPSNYQRPLTMRYYPSTSTAPSSPTSTQPTLPRNSISTATPPFTAPSSPSPVAPSPGVRLVRGTLPPGASVLPPGDPRIGGQLCWKCNGRGSLNSGILDVVFAPVLCRACNGLGRVVRADIIENE